MSKKATLKKDFAGFKAGDVLSAFYPEKGYLAYGTKKNWWSEDFVEKHTDIFEVNED